MLPVQDRRRGAFTVPLFLSVLALIHSCSARSQLIGPSQPIVAFAGDDVILPCHLEPAMDASNMLVEWKRSHPEPRFVLVRRDGMELEGKKRPSFRGRSSLFTDQLKHGNVSLKLSAVETSDQGTYRCFLPHLDGHRESNIKLVVGAVSSAVAQRSRSSGGVLLQCESAGWYPEPELLWLDAEGKVLPAGRTETLTMEIDKRRQINQEMPKTKKGGRDKMELKPQREDETQHLLEGRKAEHEDEDKQERNQSFHHISSTTERKAEEETEKRDRELQSDKQEKMEIRRQNGDQQVSGGSKPETEHEDEKGGEADITAGIQRKEEKVVNDRKLQREERVKRVQERKVETAQRKDSKQTESSRNQEGEQSNIMRMTEVYLNDVEMEDEDDNTEPEVTDEPGYMDVDPPQ